LGVFAAVAAISQAVSLVLNAIGQAMTAPLARLANDNQLDGFKNLFAKGFAVGMSLAAAITLACAGLGDEVLVFFFGTEAAGQGWYLVLLTAGGGITALAGLCGYALTALGLFRQQLLIFIPVTAITAGLSYTFVPAWGMEGAAWATVASATAQLGAAAFALSVAFQTGDWTRTAHRALGGAK
jgi:O-antigen/teichoic acid export membrane protein